MTRYTDKVVVITGASSGIGRDIAQRFYEEGATLALCSRSAERVDKATREYADIPNSQILIMSADMRNVTDIQAFVAATIERFGHIDVLVNNAGLSFPKPSIDVSPEDWDITVDTNLKGYFFMAQSVAKHMIDQESPGSIINIGSVNSATVVIGQACYAATKAGVSQMTRSLGREWARLGIRVNCVAPGSIPAECNRVMYSDPVVLKTMCEKIPMGRRGIPKEISDAVLYLASDAASYITGQTLFVDGGLTLVQG
ncbi:MAG: SDR family NAD(P)-dependent oxidoreductase [Sphaerochaetaceae bacterium]|jgi:NAD(P)-dependent dehydrogenase (short-subunit alcohol dehydrogenase family)|nr:SDR family NAD(P)-dependent oxidoreductase [Sphaerochaetaceae bacterium]